MLVAVVSDSHGNQEGLRLLGERLKAFKVGTVLHLGDDYRDLPTLKDAGFEILAVPGVYCPEYVLTEIPNRRVVELAGVKMLLSHTPQRHRADLPQDLDPQAPPPQVRLVLFGHTHIPALEERAGVVWLNPGHLMGRHDKGHPPSFALLRLSTKGVAVEIRRLEDGEVVLKGKF